MPLSGGYWLDLIESCIMTGGPLTLIMLNTTSTVSEEDASMAQRQTRNVAILLLLTVWAILILGSRGVSLSMDEPYHIARGYTYLARGRAGFWYFSHANNPPLLNAAQGALIYLGDPDSRINPQQVGRLFLLHLKAV